MNAFDTKIKNIKILNSPDYMDFNTDITAPFFNTKSKQKYIENQNNVF